MKQSKTKTKDNRRLAEIYRDWQSEDRELETSIDELRRWMYEVSQLGDPHFGETATRLEPLRQRLVQHFAREDEMIAEIASSHLTSTQKARAMNNQSLRDRGRLFAQLDDLTDRLNQLDPPFVSWQRATEEVEAFVAVLEEHERREAENMEELIPPPEIV